MAKCIVCGKRGRSHKLKHGEFNWCGRPSCFENLCEKTQSAIPVVWADREDLRFELEERFPKASIKDLHIDLPSAAFTVSDYMWSDHNFGDLFHRAIRYALILAEEDLIKSTSRDQLPLLLEHVLFPVNMKTLEDRLKGDANESKK